MSLEITPAQQDATQRNALHGAVYALSGTLLSRVNGLPNAPIRWATRTFSGGPSSDLYEAFLGPPAVIEEELAFKLGEETPGHPVGIPVRNLPFRHADSLLAAIVDEDYAWEGSTATLFVGYLKPGQTPEDLVPADWTPIRKNGQFGSPQEVQQDGFRLPLYPRDSLRRQTLNFKRAERVDWPNLDPADEGRVIPIVIGSPDSWVQMVRVDAGVYGFTARPLLSGTVSGIEFQTDFGPEQVSGLVGQQVYLHRLDKLLTVSGVTDQRVVPGSTVPWRLEFGALVDFNVPQGAVVQQRMTEYRFLPSANPCLDSGAGPSQFSGITAMALWTFDGRIIPFAFERLENASVIDITDPAAPWGVWTLFRLFDDGSSDPPGQPPVLIPRLNLPSTGAEVVNDDIIITQQPEFSPSVSTVQATKQNYPSGPSPAAAAFDGSLNTGYSLGAFGGVTFTFPNVPGGTFSNGDTIRSTLRFTSQGDIIVGDGGLTQFFHPTSASKDSYTIPLGTPQPFNQSVSFNAQTAGGGIVYEVSWEHELEADLTVDRVTDVDADADITLTSAEDVGFDMQPIRGILCKLDNGETAGGIGGVGFWDSPWFSVPLGDHEGAFPFQKNVAWPSSVFANLQKKYLEDGGNFDSASGAYSDFINMASYEAATAEYRARDLRFNFAITEPLAWPDLERQLALQCRSHAFWGPAGHQLIVIPDTAEAEQAHVEASFRLPGTPNPNVSQAPGSPLIERTSPSAIINRVEVYWARAWHIDARADVPERFQRYLIGRSDESSDVFGPRYDSEGPVLAWAIHDLSFIPSGVAYTGEVQAQDLADFVADRQAFARTRFVFETAWRSFGLTQGSVVRVAFAAAPNVFRNVVCEVEDIQTSPINAERRVLTVRSIGAPQRGLEPALTWMDLFTSEGDTWAEKITGLRDRWQHYWGVPEL